MTSLTSFHFYYSGTIILIALVLGGGTTQGLWTDHVLQILLIPALFMGLSNIHESRFSKLAIFIIMLIYGYLILQFVPFIREIKVNNSQIIIQSTLFSFTPQKSLETALYLSSILGFSLYLSRFKDADLTRLIRFFMIGLAINVTLAGFQLSYSGRTQIDGFLPYTITSATFANENHFSTLAFAALPIIAFHYLIRIKASINFIFISAIISFVLFAVGSRAGMAMALAVSTLCYLWFIPTRINFKIKSILLILIVIVSSIGAGFYAIDNAHLEVSRSISMSNTYEAAKDHILFGTSLGSFISIYPMYESVLEIGHQYINHAHNDLIEIILETGIFGIFILGMFIMLLIMQFPKSPLIQCATFGVAAIGLHSLIDYPLRTMSVAILFSFYITIILSIPSPINRQNSS